MRNSRTVLRDRFLRRIGGDMAIPASNGPAQPGGVTSFAAGFLAEAATVLAQLDCAAIERMVAVIRQTRDAGRRLFILCVGRSAAHASHAVNDFPQTFA